MSKSSYQTSVHSVSIRSLRGATGAALLVVAAFVVASGVPLTGSISGQLSGFERCEPGFLLEDLDVVLDMQCTQGVEGDFQCTGTGDVPDDPGPFSIEFQGSNFDGSINGAWTFTDDDDVGGGTLTGNFDGNTLQLFVFGSSIECTLIELNGSLAFTASGGDIVVGENTDPASGTSSGQLRGFATSTVNTIGGYAQQGLTGRRGTGGRASGNQNAMRMSGSLGLNAGDGFPSPVGAWFNYNYSDFDDDFSATAFDATRHSFLGGVDFNPWTPVLLGLAFGYETADFDTDFNSGEQDTDGWTISPYLAATLTDWVSVDVVFGYTDVDTDQFRTAGATRITSDFGADRFFWGGNVNMVKPWGNWFLTATVGYVWAREYQDEFTESNGNVVAERTIKLGQWRIGGEAAYSYGDWEPFVSATYERDYQLTEIQVAGPDQPANDRDDVMFGLGMRYYHPMGVSGSLEWNKRIGREDFDEDIINFLLRMDF